MIQEQHLKRFLAIILIAGLGALLLYGLWSYLNALLGAFVLFVIFLPLARFLKRRWRIRPGLAAGLIVCLSAVAILLPLSFLLSVLIREVQMVIGAARTQVDWWQQLAPWWPQLNLSDWADRLTSDGASAGRWLLGTLAVIGNQVVSYILMFFVLFFLIASDEERLGQAILEWMPFSHGNTLKLQREFKKVTYTTLVSSILIALGQGVLLAVGWWLFGLTTPVLWGLVAALAALVPVIGTAAVWLPAAVWQLIQGNIGLGVGLLIWGLVIASVDNFFRPLLQKRVGRIHPLVSILGVVAGLSLFGLVGLIIGPLLVSYCLLMLKMFKEEYIVG